MNKLFNFTQIKGKWHKFPSFSLGGGGAKLYKNFAQKLLAVSLCMAMVLLGTPVTTYIAEAADPVEHTEGGIMYSLDTESKKAEVTGYTADLPADVTISASVTADDGVTYSVTTIGLRAFQDCSSLTSIAIPATVTTIGHFAFASCPYLRSLSVDSANPVYTSEDNLLLSSDGTSLIACPGGLDTVTVRASVTSVAPYAFSECASLTSVTFSAPAIGIGSFAFERCATLSSVSFAGSVSIGEAAFASCFRLSSVSFGGSVGSIDERAFSGCATLSSIDVLSSVGAIGPYAFLGCGSLSSVSFGASVGSVGAYAFSDCPALSSVSFGASVGSVGAHAFSGCPELSSMAFSCDFDLKLFGWDAADGFTGESGILPASGFTADYKPTTATTYNVYMPDENDFVDAGTFTLLHDWDEGHIDPPASCVSTGERTRTCRRTGCEETSTVAVLIDENAHAWDDGEITTPATCTEPGVRTFTCEFASYHTKTEVIPALGHDLSDVVVSEPTAEKLGEVHSMCSRCTTSVAFHYTLKEGASPTMYPDGSPISSTLRTPTAASTFDLNGQEIEIRLQDPLDVFGSRATFDLGLTVRHIDLPATFDGGVDVEHSHSYEIVPTVDGVEVRGQLRDKVRLLYKIPQGWDRADLEVFLAQAGEDREFDEMTEKIGNDEYLVVWTDHFSPYVFVDKLNPEEKAALETLQYADGSNGDSNTPQNGALLTTDSPQGDSGNGQTNGDHSIKTGDASGEILMLSTLAMIATGLYLGLFLKKKKSF